MNELVNQFRELNVNNYDHDDVCVLNSWAIEAVNEIAVLQEKVDAAIKAFQDIIDAADRL